MLNISPVNLICIVINLLILFVLMKKFLYKPVLDIIAKREELINQQMAQADAAKQEAEKLKKEYESCVSAAAEQKEQTIMEAKAQARTEVDKMLTDANEKASKILEEARKAGNDEKARTIKEAESDIAKLIVSAASKIVSKGQNADNDHVIYDEFLKKAGEMSEADS